MKPNFALNLSHAGIVLLHRSPRGDWTVVGDVALDDPSLKENLSFLRSTAVALEGKGFGTKLIIPDSQILYLEMTAPGPSETDQRDQIEAALDGQTPYDVSDLVFDWRGAGPEVLVAVIARETLDEAEEFAVEHRFNPISFVGESVHDGVKWSPFFGRSDFSYAFLGADVDVRDDPVAVRKRPGADEENLFQPPVAPAKAPIAPEPATETTNIFADSPDGAETNLFEADDEEDLEDGPEDDINAYEDEAEDIPAAAAAMVAVPQTGEDPAPALPAFSSRRSGQPDEADTTDSRPLDRVAPRIAISPEITGAAPEIGPASKSPEAEGSPKRGILPDANLLRAGLLDVDASEKPSRMAFLKTGADRARRVFSALRPMAGKVLRGGKGAGRKLRDRLPARPSRRTKTAPLEAAQDEPGPGSFTAKIALPKIGRRKAAIIGSCVMAALLVSGLAYWALTSGALISKSPTSDDGTITNVSLSGGTAPLARPGDLDTSLRTIPPIRPERRSKFEGKTDPDANQPDTVTPITGLTDQERADIRAAGLPEPTEEEIADGNEGQADNGLDEAALALEYAATGILQGLAQPPNPRQAEERDDIYVASVDRKLEANDAIILPDFNTGVQDDQPAKKMSPISPLIVFDLDSKGLVKPTAQGALNPEGILVYLGKPVVTPPEKPKTEELVPPDPLRALTPKPRPADLKTGEDAIYVQGTLTASQLRAKRAKARPQSIQEQQADENATPTELAVLTSALPSHRPSDFEKIVEKTTIIMASASATADSGARSDTNVITSDEDSEPDTNNAPILPTRANVAKQATIKNVLNPSTLNLIGVYGTPSNRRALLRLPSGRYVKVEIGDRIDGGRIAAIDVDSLSYVKSGRNRILKIPQ